MPQIMVMIGDPDEGRPRIQSMFEISADAFNDPWSIDWATVGKQIGERAMDEATRRYRKAVIMVMGDRKTITWFKDHEDRLVASGWERQKADD